MNVFPLLVLARLEQSFQIVRGLEVHLSSEVGNLLPRSHCLCAGEHTNSERAVMPPEDASMMPLGTEGRFTG